MARLDSLVHPDLGLWVLNKPGVFVFAYRFGTVSEPREDEHETWPPPQGMYNVNLPKFECRLRSGPAPPLRSCELPTVDCSRGEGTLPLLDVFERGVEMSEPGSPTEVARLRPSAKRTQFKVSHFAVAGVGIFYFGRIAGAWWLLVIDTADCSA